MYYWGPFNSNKRNLHLNQISMSNMRLHNKLQADVPAVCLFIFSFPYVLMYTIKLMFSYISNIFYHNASEQTFQLVKTSYSTSLADYKGATENKPLHQIFDPYFLQEAELSNRGWKLQHASQYPINAPCLNKPFSIHPFIKNPVHITATPFHITSGSRRQQSTGGARQQLIPCT